MPSSQPLPPKENALFKRILKCYEQKQYKNGLKFAKQILSNPKFSEHGETLAMKGLTLNCLGRKEEAYDYVKKGLRNDLRSHVCWHVYGLLQRSDKKYDEAIKCYRNALKWDKDNIQILRDLSLLQIQMRDLDGYKDTRYQLFQLRPTQRASWIGFAMSYHLLEDYDMALKILEEFRKTQQKTAYDYEHSELLLYQNMVITESGDNTSALEHLEKYQDQICDKGTFLETKGRLLIKNGKLSEAEEIFRGLIKRNPENYGYYHHLEEALSADTVEKKLKMYEEFRELYPRAQAPQRLPLNAAEGEDFRKLADDYIRKALRKGVPPLFVDIRPLYASKDKIKIIEDLCSGYLENLKATCSFEKDGPQEPATTILWLYYFLGQHHDYLKDFVKALDTVNTAIEHTPTLIELFMLKGKIYKHLGDIDEAVKWMDEGQSLDTADRYINCKCAKYLLRANRLTDAEEMCAKFTREGVSAMENLNEMQCMWFQTECALAYQRMGEYGEAIKKCIEVDRHFTEIIEDQFDFHTYCMRKMTLRSYVDLLRLEDVLRSHRFYEKAAHCAIDVYLRLFDQPLKDAASMNDVETENMDPAELKKLKRKQQKAKRKAEEESKQKKQVQARKDAHQKKRNDEEMDAPPKDELVPEKLERPDSPLDEALKFLEPLQKLAAKRLTTHLLAFEVYFRKGKVLLMLQSLKRALKLDQSHPRLHLCITRFQNFIEENRSSIHESVQKVIDRETKDIFTTPTSKQRNEEFIQKHNNSLDHLIEGAKLMVRIDNSKQAEAVKLITRLDSNLEGVCLQNCEEILRLLRTNAASGFGQAGTNAAEAYRSRCHELYPHAVVFKPPKKEQHIGNHVNES